MGNYIKGNSILKMIREQIFMNIFYYISPKKYRKQNLSYCSKKTQLL